MISLKNYTLRYLVIAFLVIMTIWASIFYAFILDEVYDNVDDGLKNQKIEILREVYNQPKLLTKKDFGIEQFRIRPIDESLFYEENKLFNEFFYMPYDEDMEPYRVLKTSFNFKDGKAYELEIRTSTVEEDDLIYDLTIALAVLYIVLVLSVFLINRAVLARAWKPFDTILANVKGYTLGKQDQLESIDTNVIEFKALDSEILKTTSRMEKMYADQKLFIENASHELQTPLAITINKIEKLLDDESLSEQQIIELAESKNSLSRLVNLNKSLLILSRIENQQFKETESVSLREITEELLTELKDFIEFKSIKIVLNIESDLLMEANKDLSKAMLSNLIRNAIKYSTKEDEINIAINSKKWTISNPAKHGALDREIIFHRFYKGTQDSTSNGLGLSIVKSIVDLIPDMEVAYYFENNSHYFSLSVTNS